MRIYLTHPYHLSVVALLVLSLGINLLYAIPLARRAAVDNRLAFAKQSGLPAFNSDPLSTYPFNSINTFNPFAWTQGGYPTQTQSCDGTCLTCNGNSSNDCLTCPSSHSLQVQSCGNITGYIEVNLSSNGSFIGYVSKELDYGTFTVTTNLSDALYVSFNDSSSPFDLTIDNGENTVYPFVGADLGGGISDSNFSSTSYNYAVFSATNHTPPNSSAQTFGADPGSALNEQAGLNQPIESAIWSFSPDTDQLTPQWVNTDGSKPQTVAFYDLAEGYLGITGNLSLFTSDTLGEQIYGVNFTFVQTSVQNCSGSCVSNYPYPYYGSSGYPNFGSPYGYPNFGLYGLPNYSPYGLPNYSPYGLPNYGLYGLPNYGFYGYPYSYPYGYGQNF